MTHRRQFSFLPALLLMIVFAAACSSTSEVTDAATTDVDESATVGALGDEDGAANAPAATDTPPPATAIPTTPPQPTVDASETPAEPTPLALPPSASPAVVGTRICTVDVAYDEVLNVRDAPSLDGNVIARVPGLSCPMTVPTDADLDAEWLPVLYQTAHVRHEGFVSNEFVERNLNDIELVALEWVQAVLDGADRSAWEYGPALADDDTSMIEQLRGGLAVPYHDGSFGPCQLVGDITVECAIQVSDDAGQPIGQFVVFGSQVGANGYDASFWPDDFGDAPLVEGFTDCPVFDVCPAGEPDFGTIAIDSDAALGGVALDTPADQALVDLALFLGPPTADTDWIVGCPLDGEEDLNERYVEWGGLTVAFARWEEAPDGELWYWYYDFDTPDADPAIASRIRLPGRTRDGATLDAISEATRLPIEIHELLQEPVIFGPGWTLFGEQSGDVTRLTRAAVPFIGICD